MAWQGYHTTSCSLKTASACTLWGQRRYASEENKQDHLEQDVPMVERFWALVTTKDMAERAMLIRRSISYTNYTLFRGKIQYLWNKKYISIGF
jgi:hypothetical protein